MSSTDRSPLPALEAESRDIGGSVAALLSALVRAPAAHARFLNMLSLMEHIGSRKIMATQSNASLAHDTLRHLAEETRHAYFFKRAAERMNGRPLDYSDRDTMAASSARAYMGRLDAEIAADMGEGAGALPYLYMSLIVEIRAIWFYRLYQSALANAKPHLSLKSVLAEEELHLDAMLAEITADPKSAERIAKFRRIEDARFRTLWRAVEREAPLQEAAE